MPLLWILYIVLIVWKMSTQSCFIPDKEFKDVQRRESVSETGEMVGRSLRQRVPNRRRDYEDDLAEQANALFRSRAGYISHLTRIQGFIAVLMSQDGTYGEVVSKKDEYDEAWIKFVNAQEQYVERIVTKEEKQKALLSYERQKVRKLCLDEEIKQWCTTYNLDTIKADDVSSFLIKLNAVKNREHLFRVRGPPCL